MQLITANWKSPLGNIRIGIRGDALIKLSFADEDGDSTGEHPLIQETVRQLNAYFKQELNTFDLPFQPEGTAFQKEVWQAVQKIPYGHQLSYGELAEQLGGSALSRAVGAANGANPLLLIIPCHRVTGPKGELTGYAGGLERKAWLLDLEMNQQRLNFDIS